MTFDKKVKGTHKMSNQRNRKLEEDLGPAGYEPGGYEIQKSTTARPAQGGVIKTTTEAVHNEEAGEEAGPSGYEPGGYEKPVGVKKDSKVRVTAATEDEESQDEDEEISSTGNTHQ